MVFVCGIALRIMPLLAEGLNTFRKPPNYQLRETTVYRTNGNIRLLGYRIDGQSLRAGMTIPVTLYWDALRRGTENYQVKTQLRGTSNERIWFTSELRPPGYYPTNRWQPNLYIADYYMLPLPDTIPPGNYVLDVIVYRCTRTCNSALVFLGPNDRRLGTTLTIPAILVIE